MPNEDNKKEELETIEISLKIPYEKAVDIDEKIKKNN